jgi:hypothetical protein
VFRRDGPTRRKRRPERVCLMGVASVIESLNFSAQAKDEHRRRFEAPSARDVTVKKIADHCAGTSGPPNRAPWRASVPARTSQELMGVSRRDDGDRRRLSGARPV